MSSPPLKARASTVNRSSKRHRQLTLEVVTVNRHCFHFLREKKLRTEQHLREQEEDLKADAEGIGNGSENWK